MSLLNRKNWNATQYWYSIEQQSATPARARAKSGSISIARLNIGCANSQPFRLNW